MTRRRKKPATRQSELDKLKGEVIQKNIPAMLPTYERAERGGLVLEAVTDFAWPGERPGREAPRRVTMGYAVRDRNSEARVRLRRFKSLSPEQIEAGARLEADWEAAGLEPRMVANLLATRGGKGGDAAGAAYDARNRVFAAAQALRLGGEQVVRIVEAVVLKGATSSEAGSARYADAEKGRVYVTTLLETGLSLLATHYRIRSSRGAA